MSWTRSVRARFLIRYIGITSNVYCRVRVWFTQTDRDQALVGYDNFNETIVGRNHLIDVHIRAAPELPKSFSVVNWIEMHCVAVGASLQAKPGARNTTGESSVYFTPPAQGWSTRGFWGQSGDVFDRLVVIWGKDQLGAK